MKILEQLWNKNQLDRYNIVFDSIEKSYMIEKKKRNKKLHVAALILDAHYDPVKKVLLGHTALGG